MGLRQWVIGARRFRAAQGPYLQRKRRQNRIKNKDFWEFSLSVLGPDFLLSKLFSEIFSPFSSLNVVN